MGKTFTTMRTNIGNNVQDTSASFASKISVFINHRGREVWERALWRETINDNYTFTATAGTDTYDMLADFDEELAVVNITTGDKLIKRTNGDWWERNGESYSNGSLTSSVPKEYDIISDGTNGFPVIKLTPPPDSADTYAVPYKRIYTDLIGVSGICTTDTASKIIASSSTFITSNVVAGMRVKNTSDNTYGFILSVDSETQLTMDRDLCPDGNETFVISNEFIIEGIDWIVELGATGDALNVKRRPSEAAFYLQQYELALRRRIGRFKSPNNLSAQFIPYQRSQSNQTLLNWGSEGYSWAS